MGKGKRLKQKKLGDSDGMYISFSTCIDDPEVIEVTGDGITCDLRIDFSTTPPKIKLKYNAIKNPDCEEGFGVLEKVNRIGDLLQQNPETIVRFLQKVASHK